MLLFADYCESIKYFDSDRLLYVLCPRKYIGLLSMDNRDNRSRFWRLPVAVDPEAGLYLVHCKTTTRNVLPLHSRRQEATFPVSLCTTNRRKSEIHNQSVMCNQHQPKITSKSHPLFKMFQPSGQAEGSRISASSNYLRHERHKMRVHRIYIITLGKPTAKTQSSYQKLAVDEKFKRPRMFLLVLTEGEIKRKAEKGDCIRPQHHLCIHLSKARDAAYLRPAVLSGSWIRGQEQRSVHNLLSQNTTGV